MYIRYPIGNALAGTRIFEHTVADPHSNVEIAVMDYMFHPCLDGDYRKWMETANWSTLREAERRASQRLSYSMPIGRDLWSSVNISMLRSSSNWCVLRLKTVWEKSDV